jgi:hypothetical protein
LATGGGGGSKHAVSWSNTWTGRLPPVLSKLPAAKRLSMEPATLKRVWPNNQEVVSIDQCHILCVGPFVNHVPFPILFKCSLVLPRKVDWQVSSTEKYSSMSECNCVRSTQFDTHHNTVLYIALRLNPQAVAGMPPPSPCLTPTLIESV